MSIMQKNATVFKEMPMCVGSDWTSKFCQLRICTDNTVFVERKQMPNIFRFYRAELICMSCINLHRRNSVKAKYGMLGWDYDICQATHTLCFSFKRYKGQEDLYRLSFKKYMWIFFNTAVQSWIDVHANNDYKKRRLCSGISVTSFSRIHYLHIRPLDFVRQVKGMLHLVTDTQTLTKWCIAYCEFCPQIIDSIVHQISRECGFLSLKLRNVRLIGLHELISI